MIRYYSLIFYIFTVNLHTLVCTTVLIIFYNKFIKFRAIVYPKTDN